MANLSVSKDHKIVAIIQARMGSTRLPGKVLKKINGLSMLEILINRVQESKLLSEIVVATSTEETDNLIYEHCKEIGVCCFRGSENDVLNRYYECALEYQADVVVRLTSDCPLIDYSLIDKVLDLFFTSDSDYSANTVPPQTSKFPDGSDIEIFSMQALEKANEQATSLPDREHVTFFFWKNETPNKFKTTQLENEEDFSSFRFTVDYPEDLEVVSFVLEQLRLDKKFGHLSEVIDILKRNPKIKELNSKYFFGIGWNKDE